MPPVDLATSLRRRQAARDKMKRYWHTRSFNHLAGRSAAPVAHRRDQRRSFQIAFVVAGVLFFAIGGYFLFF